MTRAMGSVLFALLLLGGCASGLTYKSLSPNLPPRGAADQIRVVEPGQPPPGEPFDRLGEISWDYQRTKFTPPVLPEVLGDLKQKAWEVGGDALLIRSLSQPRSGEDPLRIQADVVRFRR